MWMGLQYTLEPLSLCITSKKDVTCSTSLSDVNCMLWSVELASSLQVLLTEHHPHISLPEHSRFP